MLNRNMEELTGFQRDLVYVIVNLDKPSGQDIRRELESYYDGGVNHGRLYPNLEILVEEGFVNKGTQDQRTNYYEITDKGIELLQSRHDWVNNLVNTEEVTGIAA